MAEVRFNYGNEFIQRTNDGGSIGGDNKNEEQIINGHILQNLRGRGLPNGVVQQCMENL